MSKLNLSCACSAVQGETTEIDSSSGTRVVCCCKDCQSFAEFLNQEDTVLDTYGGTELFQMPVAHVKITKGAEQIRCVRLSAKGLHRWYTACCNTPIGNTLGAGAPFIGLIHNFMGNTPTRDKDLGMVLGYIQLKSAKKRVPQALIGSQLKILARTLSKLLIWKLKGFNTPSSFFDKDGQPIVEPIILDH
jgi:hypothetical protein